jgi:predicted phage tail protein
MKTIILGGLLGERFGTTWNLDVKNAKEACYAIAQMLPAFDKFMREAHQEGIEFAVYHGRDNNIGYEELDIVTSAKEIFIDPVIGGSKEGVLQAVIGAVLVVAGIVVNVVAPGSGTPLIYAGVAMLAGGVAMMLMPPMDATDQNQDGNKPNKGFGGAVTTVASGVPVPILYGERDVGGFFISGEFIPRDQ